LEKAVEACLTQLAGESASKLEQFRAEAQVFAGQLQSEVESHAREFSEKASQAATEKLQATVEGVLELAARNLNKQADDALELLKGALRSAQEQCVEETRRLLESFRTQVQVEADESAARMTAEVKSKTEQALRELPDRLYKGIGMAALVVKESEEEAKTRLECHSRQALETFQKQLEELTMAAQERQHSDAETLKGMLRSRLQQAAQLFEGLETSAGQSKGAGREESGNSTVQPLRPVLEPLVEKQQQIMEEAVAAFRSRLSQFLADYQPKE
jgi:hypothetical protein